MGCSSSSSKAIEMASSAKRKRSKTDTGESCTRSPGFSVGGLNIGIDLGTANICVGVIHNGDLEIIPNELGKQLTPNVVSFSENGPLIGDAAQDLLAIDSSHTIFDLKRLMGRPARIVAENNWRFPFTVTDMPGRNKACIQIDDKTYNPEDICAKVLSKIKARVTDHLDQTVTGAVITVPGCFKHSQRQATMSAAKLAGFEEVRLVDDNIAAAIMYGQKVKLSQSRSTTILIFSVGSGTVEASVVKISREKSGYNKFEVKGKSGSSILGGIEFDKTLQKQMKEKIRKHGGARLGDDRHTARLRKISEKVKHVLTTGPVASFEFNEIVDELYDRDTIKKAEFEEGNAEYFKICLEHIDIAIEESNTAPEEIDEIVLVGGSTRIPKLKSLIENNPMLEGIKINKSLQRDDTIASGAAFLADSLSDQEIQITNICPYSVMCGNTKHFSRNHTIPATFQYKPSSEKGTIFPVYEYHEQTKDMELMYSVKLLKQVKTDVVFCVDVNGICSTFENNNYIQQNDGPGTLSIEEMTQQQHALEVQSGKVEKQEERKKAVNEAEKQVLESEVSKTAEFSKVQETLPEMGHKLQEDTEQLNVEQHIEGPHNKTGEKDQKKKQANCSEPKAQRTSKGKLKRKTSNAQETQASKEKLKEKQLLEIKIQEINQWAMDLTNQSEMLKMTLPRHYTEIQKLLTECKAQMDLTKENGKKMSQSWKKLTELIENKLKNILNYIEKINLKLEKKMKDAGILLKKDEDSINERKTTIDLKCKATKSQMKTKKSLGLSDIIEFVTKVNECQKEMLGILKYGRDKVKTDKDIYKEHMFEFSGDVEEDAKQLRKFWDSIAKVNLKKSQTQNIKKPDATHEVRALEKVENENDTNVKMQRTEEPTSPVGIKEDLRKKVLGLIGQILKTMNEQQQTIPPSLDKDKTDILRMVGQLEHCLENQVSEQKTNERYVMLQHKYVEFQEKWKCQASNDLRKLLEEINAYLKEHCGEPGIEHQLKQAFIRARDTKYTSAEVVQQVTKDLRGILKDCKEQFETAKSELNKLVKEVKSYQNEFTPTFEALMDEAEQLLRNNYKSVTRSKYLDHTAELHKEAKSMLSRYVYNMRTQPKSQKIAEETDKWMAQNTGATAEEYLKRKQELKDKINEPKEQKTTSYLNKLDKKKKNKSKK